MVDEFKNFKEIPQLPREPAKPIVNREKVRLYKGKAKEQVVNSEDIKWKPVDVVAARVVAPAAWWAEPPQPEPTMKDHKVPIEFTLASTGIPKDQAKEKRKYEKEDMATDLVREMPKHFGQSVEQSEHLVERAKEATAAIEYLANNVKESWVEFDDWVKKAIAATRQNKIAMEIETRQLMADFKDVRAFFLDEKHLEEVNRLEKFVYLCRELKALKDTGFLEAVTDIILRLND